MVRHQFPVLRELLLCHIPRRDILVRLFVDLWIQMHRPCRTDDHVSLAECVPAQLDRLRDGPHGHGGSSKTEGLLDRRIQ